MPVASIAAATNTGAGNLPHGYESAEQNKKSRAKCAAFFVSGTKSRRAIGAAAGVVSGSGTA
jgi:hypothetical protein